MVNEMTKTCQDAGSYFLRAKEGKISKMEIGLNKRDNLLYISKLPLSY